MRACVCEAIGGWGERKEERNGAIFPICMPWASFFFFRGPQEEEEEEGGVVVGAGAIIGVFEYGNWNIGKGYWQSLSRGIDNYWE